MKATEFAVRRKRSAAAILISLIVLGLYGLWRLPVDFLPEITYPLIRIHVWWRGATPEEIEKNIAAPLERQIATVDDLDFLESSSVEGMCTVLANFHYGVDVNVAYQDVLAAMNRAVRELPPDIDPPVVFKADPSQLPVLQLTASSERWDLVELRSWVDEWLRDQILAVSGVAGAEIVGGLKREIRVHVDPLALEKHGLSLSHVLSRLEQENVERFGGRVTVGSREIIARTVGEFRNLEEIRSVVLLRAGPARILLGDVAEVVDASEEPRVLTRLDGNPCVKLSVLKQASANTVEVARAVERRLADLESALPEGVRLGMVENQATYVASALGGVQRAALQAGLLLILIVYLFLASWRQVLVLVLALPVTLILNFGLMKVAGFSLNIFSLGGLVIAIGVLLDNSIVVIENIARRRSVLPEDTADEAAIAATSEVGPAVRAATLSFLALFLPFLLVPGLTSLLFRELILVIAGIVVISLAVAVTITPMLSALLAAPPSQAGPSRFERFFGTLTALYGRLLEKVLALRWVVLAAFLLALGGAVLLFGRLGTEFLPRMDDGRIMVKLRMPTGASLAETDAILRRLEQALERDEWVQSAFTMAGGRVWGLYTYEIANEGEINLQLVPRNRRPMSTQAYVERLRPSVSRVPVPGGAAMVQQMRVRGIRRLGDADIEVKVKGSDLALLFEQARRTAAAMNELDDFTGVHVSMDMTKPEFQVRLDRIRAAEFGITAAEIGQALRTLISGSVATRYREGEEYFNIRVMVPEERIVARQDIENLRIDAPLGGHLRLADVAEVVSAQGPVEIVRENQVKQVTIRGDVTGSSVGAALAALRRTLARVELPPGYERSYGGQAQMMADMQRTLLTVLVFALFFSFMILAVQFDSFRLPALILACIPFCLAGLVFLLYLSGLPLGATVLIGVLVVVAATIGDGVLLFTFARELEAGGLPPRQAVLEAARIRLRPRVMTTTSTLVAFLPLALALEEGGDMLQPMAAGAVGGLLMEILVALLLMPCLYVFAAQLRNPKT